MHGTCSLFPLLCTVQIDSYIIEIKLKKKNQHSLITAFPVHLHHSFFFAKWGTMPVSSWARGLPSSFIFRLSSASWDRYFCNHIKNPKHCYQNWKYSRQDSLCLFRALTLPASQKEWKHTEAPFCWKLKPENLAVSGKLPEHMQSLRRFRGLLRATRRTGDRTRSYPPSVCVTRPHLFSTPLLYRAGTNCTESIEFC